MSTPSASTRTRCRRPGRRTTSPSRTTSRPRGRPTRRSSPRPPRARQHQPPAHARPGHHAAAHPGAAGHPDEELRHQLEAGCPEPQTPGTPQAQSGDGSITLTFQPASGLTPKRYLLKGLGSGQTATPSEVGPNGPFTFQVDGGACDTEFSYTVVAEYAAGAASKESKASAPVRPCVAPGAPQSLKVSNNAGGHGAKVSWKAPSGASGVTYKVTWSTGSQSTQSTSQSITGLENGRQYNVSVSTSNAAGSGASTSGTIDLTPPDQTMNITHNSNDSGPAVDPQRPQHQVRQPGDAVPGELHGRRHRPLRTTGRPETQPYDHVTSDVWGKISWNGNNGYVADVYLDSRFNSSVWECQ